MHCPVFWIKQNVSGTGFCLRLQVGPIQLGPIDRAILCLRETETSCIYWPQLSRFHLKTETDPVSETLFSGLLEF
jgi:hypothetical protein